MKIHLHLPRKTVMKMNDNVRLVRRIYQSQPYQRSGCPTLLCTLSRLTRVPIPSTSHNSGTLHIPYLYNDSRVHLGLYQTTVQFRRLRCTLYLPALSPSLRVCLLAVTQISIHHRMWQTREVSIRLPRSLRNPSLLPSMLQFQGIQGTQVHLIRTLIIIKQNNLLRVYDYVINCQRVIYIYIVSMIMYSTYILCTFL
jgi:hypothetical protein